MIVRLTSNALAVCGAAACAGAMMLIGYALGSFWRSLPPAAFLDWFSANSYLLGRVMFTLTGVTALGLVSSLWLDRKDTRLRVLWGGALASVFVVGLVTTVYELPLNAAFMARATPVNEVGAALDSWLWWHTVRIIFGLLAAVLGVAALARRGADIPATANTVMRIC